MSDLCKNGGVTAMDESNPHHFKEVKDYTDFLAVLGQIIKECPEPDERVIAEYYRISIVNVYINSKDSITGNYCFTQLGVEDHFRTPIYKHPYSLWNPSDCKSSCVAELDPIYREFSKYPICDMQTTYFSLSTDYNEFRENCEILKKFNEPLSACGKNYDPNADDIDYFGIDGYDSEYSANKVQNTDKSNSNSNSTSSIFSTSDSTTTLTSHVALFSLIMCIIFAFFK